MEKKITIYYTHDSENDTLLMYSTSKDRNEIELKYYGPDPDCDESIKILGGDADASMLDLAKEQLEAITAYLDETNNGYNRSKSADMTFDEYCNSALYAWENMLREVVGSTDTARRFVNTNGRKYIVLPVSDAARTVMDAFVNDKVKYMYLAANHYCKDDINDMECWTEWYKIVQTDLPFDSEEPDMALMMGYCGGGCVKMAYTNDCNDTGDFISEIEKMICSAAELHSDNKVYLEFVEDENTKEDN